MNKCTYYVDGMHCPSCEILIEKNIKKKFGSDTVNANLSKNTVEMSYTKSKPTPDELNTLFSNMGYSFSTSKNAIGNTKKVSMQNAFIAASFLALGFILLEKTGISSLISVDSSSSLFGFLLFGVVASVSSCAALVGGMLLSMSKKWHETYITEDITKKSIPYVLFNLGRLIAFAVFGALLGILGSFLNISLEVTSAIVILVALFMVFSGLQMLGVKWFNKVHLETPKFFSRYITNEDNFNGRLMPLIMGMLTFFVPCGFTVIAQGIALTSGSALKGALIMFSFALGTLPMLIGISYSSLKLNSKQILAAKFNYIAGFLIIFFGAYTLNSQLNVLGFKSLSDIKLSRPSTVSTDSLAGSQLVQLEARGYNYYPRNVTIKAGVPTRLEILNTGATGCANAVVGRGLFNGVFVLKDGVNTVNFTPMTPGDYKITCSMGMVPPVSVKVI